MKRSTTSLVLGLAIVTAGVPAVLGGCDRTENKTKTTTTKTTDTPEGVKKTTETTERKVETEQK